MRTRFPPELVAVAVMVGRVAVRALTAVCLSLRPCRLVNEARTGHHADPSDDPAVAAAAAGS
jgi:hypothetical protein